MTSSAPARRSSLRSARDRSVRSYGQATPSGARLCDLTAVVDKLGLPPSRSTEWGSAGCAAVTHAVDHPERVTTSSSMIRSSARPTTSTVRVEPLNPAEDWEDYRERRLDDTARH
jgi:hypothetical protein